MYPVSAEFRAACVASCQQAISMVSVMVDDDVLTDDLGSTAGVVTCDGTRDGPLRTLSLTASPDPDAFGYLSTAGAELHVWRGLVLPDGTEELVPLGVFVVDADLTEAADGTITVSAADRAQRISRARWVDPYKVASGVNVGDAIEGILTTCWPGCPIGRSFAAVTKTTGAQLTYLAGAESDPWRDARALAASDGYDLYFDAEGVAQIRQTPDRAAGNVCATYYAGDEAVVLEQTRVAILSQAYNGVVVEAVGSGVGTPKRGEAWDDDPTSPTYRHGPMGQVPMFYSSPLLTTQDDVDSAAETILARVVGLNEQRVFSMVVNPAHEACDIVEFVDEAGEATRYMMDVVAIPLDASGAMTMTSRQTPVE
jgi:hypothetical protein